MHLKIKGGATGATTHVYVDGKKVGRCYRAIYDVTAGSLAKVTLELWPEKVEIAGTVGKIDRVIKKLPGRRPKRK